MSPISEISPPRKIKNEVLRIMRYVVSGLAGTGTYALVFAGLNETILSAGADIAGTTRGLNFFIANSLAFLASSILVYLLNRHWVFMPGRHSKTKEIILFYGVAIIAFLISTSIGTYFVNIVVLNEYIAGLVTIILSVGINFVGRRWLVFKLD